MLNDNKEMRDIMELIEDYASIDTKVAPITEEVIPQEQKSNPVLAELRESIFKLRSHTENEDTEHSLGVEEGMQRAADIIENLIRRHEGNNLG